MKNHMQLDNASFEHQFEKGNLHPSLFDHEAHLRLAWLYIKKYGEQKAIDKACQGIQSFDKLHGDGNKFHKTLTVASVKVVNHFMRKSSSSSFQGFTAEFPKLKTSFKELLGQHYGFDLFVDQKAKKEYVAPDLLPF